MKTILVDAVFCFVSPEGEIFDELFQLLETYPNKKIILTGANDEQFQKFGLDNMPYEVFTQKHNPEKTNPEYYKTLLIQFHLKEDEVVYVEHSKEAVESARSVGIESYLYDDETKNVEGIKKFLNETLSVESR